MNACQLATPSPSDLLNSLPSSKIAPVGARPGVEQDADHRQVDHRAGASDRVEAVEVQAAPHSAGLEVPPPAVERDIKVGKAAQGQIGDLGGRAGQRIVVHGEPCGVTGAGAGQQMVGPGADLGGAAQGVRRIHTNPRPIVLFRSSASGTGPGVK